MSTIRFANYSGIGVQNSDAFSYSQAVAVGPVLKCSGQGGWDSEGVISSSVVEQVNLAFDNVELALQSVEPEAGWKDVYQVRSYHTNVEESFDLVVALFRKRMPGRRPIWTCVEVSKLGIPGMAIEIEVEAYLEKSNK